GPNNCSTIVVVPCFNRVKHPLYSFIEERSFDICSFRNSKAYAECHQDTASHVVDPLLDAAVSPCNRPKRENAGHCSIPASCNHHDNNHACNLQPERRMSRKKDREQTAKESRSFGIADIREKPDAPGRTPSGLDDFLLCPLLLTMSFPDHPDP